MRGVLILMIGSLPCLVSGQEVGLQEFVRQLSNQQGFEVKGVELLGNSRMEITGRNAKTEELISRALRHYNHVVKYADGEVSSVVIFGRKGNDVGSLPETYGDPEPEEEN